jgi:hypothetical protein
MTSKVTAESYLHSGVNDSAVHVTAVSMTPLCTSQRSQWLRQIFSKFTYLHSGVNDSAVHVTAESVSQIVFNLFFNWWIHEMWEVSLWYVWKNLNICTAESMTPLKFFQNFIFAQQSQWLRCASHSGVNDSAVHVTAESMTPLCTSQRSHWLCCDKTRWLQSRFARRILIHIEKGFNPCLRGLGGVVWWKNQRSKISCQGPFKSTTVN